MSRGEAVDPRPLTLRAKILAIVAFGIVVPVALVGAWTTRRLERAGRELLTSELDSALATMDRSVQREWSNRRGEIMLLAENVVAARLLGDETATPDSTERDFLAEAYAQVQTSMSEAVWVDATGTARWRIGPDPGGSLDLSRVTQESSPPRSRLGVLAVRLPITGDTGQPIGALIALVRVAALTPSTPLLGIPGASLQIVDTATAIPVSVYDASGGRVPGTSPSPETDLITVSRRINTLPVTLMASAPAVTYIAPFSSGARSGTILTLAILLLVLGGAVVLTSRITRSLGALAKAAEAVAAGNFDRRIEVGSRDELGRVALAFNTMTRDLQRSMHEAAERKALAAVGEFAAELAHEVRNPLTAVRLDLQRLDERLPAEGDLRDRLRRVLAVIDRLNRTVTGSLRVARSGSAVLQPVPLSSAIEPAIEGAMPEFNAREVVVKRDQADYATLWLHGDADALTQLFLNLLLNAAQAIDNRGTVSISATHQNGSVLVSIADTGPGIPDRILESLHEPLHSTKRSGTGLGLVIARRIAHAHGGVLEFRSTGAGTTVMVTLRSATPASPPAR